MGAAQDTVAKRPRPLLLLARKRGRHVAQLLITTAGGPLHDRQPERAPPQQPARQRGGARRQDWDAQGRARVVRVSLVPGRWARLRAPCRAGQRRRDQLVTAAERWRRQWKGEDQSEVSARTRASRRARPPQTSAAMMSGKTVGNQADPARSWVAIAPPR